MTLQEIFDKSVSGVIAQGGPSLNTKGDCMYRGNAGRKCAAGQLIPDDKYEKRFENVKVGAPTSTGDCIRNAIGLRNDWSYRANRVVSALQSGHDSASIGGPGKKQFLQLFRERCYAVAKEFDLNTDVLA